MVAVVDFQKDPMALVHGYSKVLVALAKEKNYHKSVLQTSNKQGQTALEALQAMQTPASCKEPDQYAAAKAQAIQALKN